MPGTVIPPGPLPDSPAAGTLATDSGDGNKLKQHTGTGWRSFLDGDTALPQGNINYCSNPGAETDTTGWATYADAAGTQPVNGTGGTPSVTWTRSTGSPLRGVASFLFTKDAANRQGQGVSYAFTLSQADMNRQLTVSFDFYWASAPSGNVFSVWVYDVTNAKLVPISDNVIPDYSGQVTVHFTTTSSLSYRFIIHCAGTATTGTTFLVDNVSISPTWLPGMPAMSDWRDGGAISIGAVTTAPTKPSAGNIQRDKVWYKRAGDQGLFRYEYEHNASGADGSGDYLFSLPAGLSFDSAKVEFYTGTAASLACARYGRSAGYTFMWDTAHYQINIVPYDATRFRLYGLNAPGNAGYFASSGSMMRLALTPIRLALEFAAPITGWSGTVAVQPGSRYLWAQRYAANATRVTTTPSAPGQYRARRLGADTAPTTAPSAADGFRIDAGSGIAAGRINQYDIYIGPGKTVALTPFKSAGRTGTLDMGYFYSTVAYGCGSHYDPTTGVFTILALCTNAGDCVGVDPGVALGGVTPGYFDLLIADDPVAIAQAPSVHVEATTDAGQTITKDTEDIDFEDVAEDTHGSWATNTFTAPVSGLYLFEVHLQFGNATASRKPFVRYGSDNYKMGVSGTFSECVGVAVVRVAQGATATIRISDNDGTLDSSPTNKGNRLTITRIGD